MASLVPALSLFLTRAAFAEEPSVATDDAALAARRLRVERAEEELRLRQREAEVAREERKLDRMEAARRAPPPADAERFSRAGRVVLPRLAGLSLSAGSLGGLGVGSLGGLGAGWSGIVSFSTRSANVGTNGQSTTAISFNPSVDVFLGDHWTVGGLAQVFRTTQSYEYTPAGFSRIETESSGYGVSVMPRVGRTFDLGPVTVWPKLGAGYGVSRVEEAGNQTPGRAIQRSIYAALDLDVVLRLSPNVFLDMGPTLSYVHASGESNRGIDRGDTDADDLSAGVQAHLGVTF